MADDWDLGRLLAPVDPADFRREHWGERHLHLHRADPHYYASLVGWEELERHLEQDGFFDTPLGELRSADPIARRPAESLEQVREALADGETLLLRGMRSFLPEGHPLVSLIADLDERLDCWAKASCFVTPAGERALPTHFDHEHSFTLQLVGRKRWRLFRRIAPDEADSSPLDPGERIAEFVLEPGSLLYVPARQLHEVTAQDELSVSVGLGALA